MPRDYDENDVVIELDDDDDNDACDTCARAPLDGDEPVTEGFDKFMDDILIKESRRHEGGDSPQRERARRHQERPLGRIRFGATR